MGTSRQNRVVQPEEKYHATHCHLIQSVGGEPVWVVIARTRRYSQPVPLLVRLYTTGRYLSVRVGTCTRRLRIDSSKHSMLMFTVPNPRVRLSSVTNTQGLPQYRLPIMASQNSSSHVPANDGITYIVGGER